MSKQTTISWTHKDADYSVTVEFSGGRPMFANPLKGSYSPEEPVEMEIQDIQIAGRGGPITDNMYALAQEDDTLYQRALDQISADHDDEDRGRHY